MCYILGFGHKWCFKTKEKEFLRKQSLQNQNYETSGESLGIYDNYPNNTEKNVF